MFTLVIERKSVFVCIVTNAVSDGVVHIVHQMAFLNGQNLVKRTRGVVTHGFWMFVAYATGNFFRCEPAFVRKSEFHLVSVSLRLCGTQNGGAFGQFNFADACQLVHYLLLLVCNLVFIGENLPLASAAHSEMRAESASPALAIFVEFYSHRFGIAMFFSCELKVHHIARNHIGNEYYQVIYAHQRFAFCCHLSDFHGLKKG